MSMSLSSVIPTIESNRFLAMVVNDKFCELLLLYAFIIRIVIRNSTIMLLMQIWKKFGENVTI